MRTLFVMRHCKSRWDKPDVTDHERGLKKRGKRDAPMLGQALARRADPPDLVISSTARRARSTARRVAEAWGYEGDIRLDETLYEDGPLQCIDILRALPDSIASVLLIGHNPMLENLIWALGGPRLAMPTGATVRLDLDIDHWAELDLTSNIVMGLMLIPRELRGRT